MGTEGNAHNTVLLYCMCWMHTCISISIPGHGTEPFYVSSWLDYTKALGEFLYTQAPQHLYKER